MVGVKIPHFRSLHQLPYKRLAGESVQPFAAGEKKYPLGLTYCETADL